MNLEFEIPSGAEYESQCGLFYRKKCGELWFYNHAKGGWCMSLERPFLRPIEDGSEKEITAVPVEYCEQVEVALLKKCIEIELRKGHTEDHARVLGESAALDILEAITEVFFE